MSNNSRREGKENAGGNRPVWTAEQQDAINSRTGNILVTAAAGAGKTAVLVERIIRRITDLTERTDVDRLLVLTFTNAAATEMRERVGRALAARLDAQPDSQHLSRQMSLINHASIGTIHSFCLEVIRQHFYQVDLDPAFRIADETEAILIQTEVLETLFERRYSSGEQGSFQTLVDCYGGKKDDVALQTLVLDIYRLARSTPQPSRWLESLASCFAVSDDAALDLLPWCISLKQSLTLELNGVVSILELAMRLSGKTGGLEGYTDTLQAECDAVSNLARACAAGDSWDLLVSLAQTVDFGKLKAVRGIAVEPELKKQVTDLRDKAKKKVRGIKEDYFARGAAEVLADLRLLVPLIQELTALVADFDRLYQETKLANSLLDFNDLEHYCLRILSATKAESGDEPVPSEVALEIRRRFVEVLVDEYQDINAVQEAILRLVSRQDEPHPNLFMVGDVKQSIYRFRLAEPGLFMTKQASYLPLPEAREKRISLVKNFRSRRGVIDAVNFVFRQLMSPAVSELAYGVDAELVYGGAYSHSGDGVTAGEDTVELYINEYVKPEESEERLETNAGAGYANKPVAEGEEMDPDAIQLEARLIAARIEALLGNDSAKSEAMQARPLTYRDIVILMRATSGYANTFLEEFRRLGVPVYAALGTGYFEATEVKTMLSLLRVLDNPRQDIPLAGVLRSPIVGLTAEELAQIKLCRRQGDFLDAVLSAAASLEGEIAPSLTGFLEKLEKWRTLARQGSLADLIWMLYRDTGYYDFVGGLPGGRQRQANLRVLQQRAQQYEEKTGLRGLFLFLRFIERVWEGGSDLGAVGALNEKENVVRLMSIHKSKGLEFPVVFVAGLGKKFNLKDLNKIILLHKDLGLGPQFIDVERRITYPTLTKLAVKQRLRMDSLAEELRVLYVAMTRAKEKLILVGTVRNLKSHARRWCNSVTVRGWNLPDAELAGANTYLDWLMPALVRHPDGAKIRELALGDEETAVMFPEGDASKWRVFFKEGKIISDPEKQADNNLLNQVRRLEPLVTDNRLKNIINNRLLWGYPGLAWAGCAAKTSMSELKRRFDNQQEVSGLNYQANLGRRPIFMQRERGLTAAEKGSVLHLVLQNLDLKQAASAVMIQEQVAEMLKQELLTREQATAVPVGKIATFFQSPLGRRVLAGEKVFRELPFTLALPAGEIYPKADSGVSEIVLTQGIIDCFVDEGDGVVLLDYKTDQVDKERLEQVSSHYRGQLNLYARAVEDIYGQKVKEKYLYLFYLDIAVRCD